MAIVNGFWNLNINNVNHSSTLSPNFVFFNVKQFGCSLFKNRVPEIYPEINTDEIDGFDFFFFFFRSKKK